MALPALYWATWSGQLAMTSSTTGSRAEVSLTWRMPRSSTMCAGSSPDSAMSAKTSRPWLEEMASVESSSARLLIWAGVMEVSAMPWPWPLR